MKTIALITCICFAFVAKAEFHILSGVTPADHNTRVEFFIQQDSVGEEMTIEINGKVIPLEINIGPKFSPDPVKEVPRIAFESVTTKEKGIKKYIVMPGTIDTLTSQEYIYHDSVYIQCTDARVYIALPFRSEHLYEDPNNFKFTAQLLSNIWDLYLMTKSAKIKILELALKRMGDELLPQMRQEIGFGIVQPGTMGSQWYSNYLEKQGITSKVYSIPILPNESDTDSTSSSTNWPTMWGPAGGSPDMGKPIDGKW